MPPKLNRRRAISVLRKIDEIMAWEVRHENDRDTRFVELGQHLCEVRAGQYLAAGTAEVLRRVPGAAVPGVTTESVLPDVDSRAFAPAGQKGLTRGGLDEGGGVGQTGTPQGQRFESAPWLHKARQMPKAEFQREVEKELTGEDSEPSELIYF